MATTNYTEEEIQFRKRARRRLVGAVVLVVIVVAVVPMILPESKPQQDSQPIDIRIPSQDATGYAPKILPAPEQAAPSVKPAELAPPPTLNAAEPLPAANGAKSAAEAKPEPAPAPKPAAAPAEAKPAPLVKAMPEPGKPVKPADSAKQTYFVQYGAFSEMKNAKQRQADLKAKGVNTFTEIVKTTAGDKIRVRSGPYTARDQADKVREQVKPIDSKLVVVGNNA